MAEKLARPGSEGNTRLLKQYGGGSSPPRQSYAGVKGYATGGAVRGDNPSLAEGLAASGSPAKPNLSRPGRKMAGKGKSKKDAKTNITVVVAPNGKGDEKPPMPMPVPVPGPSAGPPMPPMPMPPPGAGPGGPPMPMRAKGGRVNHDDAKKDKAAIKAAVHKHEKHDHPGKPLTKLSVGGPAKPPKGFDAGAGGAEGRLEKARKYGK